ncbi:hypothetical protein RhiirA1_460009 [Rhizophagus irregularis]|uniref:Uncharacterized protein n=1 Tax=Rhizophagus irregularis TaxID=588596 RepID=A0A2N0RSE3_9GLOM|nr:hypothetical protein RhiirA1_460009 [Rhizophagus irregularis]
MKLLKGILQPNEDQSSYYVVSGEHGTGKTISIKITSNKVGQDDKGTQGGMGVPANIEKFAEEFAKAINFSFEKYYLTAKCNINAEESRKLYNLVGSYYRTEKSVTDDFLNGQTFEIIEQEILMKVEDKLRTAKLLEGHDFKQFQELKLLENA